MTTENGIYKDISNSDYHASGRLSKSGLSQFAKSPFAYKNQVWKDSAAFAFGTAYHTLILEPELFEKEIAIAPIINKRTKVGKAEWAEFEELNKSKTIISHIEYLQLHEMKKAMMKHETASSLLYLDGGRLGDAELSVFATDEKTGVDVQCRPDMTRHDGIMIDLKTCQSLSTFKYDAFKYGYNMQAAWYLHWYNEQALLCGKEKCTSFLFVAQEKKAPYEVGIFEFTQNELKMANDKWRSLLNRYAKCKENDCWPMNEEVVKLGKPDRRTAF